MKGNPHWGFFFGSHHSMSKKFWLMKSEPSECSVQSVLAMPEHRVDWFGIRNYQARNFMRDEMNIGDEVLFYHSSCKEPGVAGLARVASEVHPDETQFDPTSEYYDPKSTRENPRWVCVDIEVLEECPVLGIAELRQHPELAEMQILKKGNRLSITPLTEDEYRFIIRLLRKDT